MVGKDDDAAFQLFKKYTYHHDGDIRDWAYNGISNLNSYTAIAELTSRIGTENSYYVRSHFPLYLKRIGLNWQGNKSIRLNLTSKDDHMALFAIYNVELFAKQKKAFHIDILEKYLVSDKGEFREAAAYALGDIMSKESGGKLIDAYNNESRPFVKANIIQALGRIRYTMAMPLLIKEMKSDVFYIRINSAEALGIIKAQQAIPTLIEALDDDEFNVASASNKALENITKQKVRDAKGLWSKKLWLKWWEENKHKYEQLEETSAPDVGTKAPTAAPAQ